MVALIFPAHEAPGGARSTRSTFEKRVAASCTGIHFTFGRSTGTADRIATRGWTSGVRKWKHTRGYVSGVRKVTVDLDQENLLSSDLVAGVICVMALNLVFLAAGMLLGQVIEY